MKANYIKTIKGYTALARFLVDVPMDNVVEVDRNKIEGLPESRYVCSPTAIIETKGNMKFVRVETSHARYSIFEIV